MSDGELEELAKTAGQLTDAAREALQLEVTHRRLDLELQPVSEAQPPPPLPNPVTLRAFRDIPEALLARTILESAGMPCYLADENLIRLDWFYSNALGGIKLWVNEEDVEAATALLDAEIPATFPIQGQEDYTQPRCPKCQSLDITLEDLEQRSARAVAWIVFTPFLKTRRRWKCNACAFEWPDAEYDAAAT
jgi:hypothetical protein